MRKVLLALVTMSLLLGAESAHAARGLVVGIGDQKTEMFTDARLDWLGIRHARLVVPWYVGSGVNAEELAYVDRWLKAARRAGVQPLVGFGHGFVGWTRIYLPKPAEYRGAVAAFRKRYPWVRTYIAWNEANHCSQPTCRNPARAAAYFDALTEVCRSCRIAAVSLIDQPNMVSWLRRFRRAAKHRPSIYGLHNYLDVNRLRERGTRRLVRAVPKGARIWITETGGLVRRKHYKRKADFPENAVHAGRVTAYLLRTALRLPKIDRVYLYHWNVDRADATWDSGLIDERGVSRPGFSALARWLRLDLASVPDTLVAPPLPVPAREPPAATNPPPTEPEPSPSPSPSPSPQPQPQPQPEPDPPCSLVILCPPRAM